MARKKTILDSKTVQTTTTDRASLIDAIFKDLNKTFAEVRLREGDYQCCPSGNAAVDFIATDRMDGTGGWPFGRIIELYGNESTGKSMLGYLALINCIHSMNGIGVLIDSENSFTPSFYKLLGGDENELIKFPPKHINEVYEFMTTFMKTVRAKTPDRPMVIVYDSLAASPTLEEWTEGMGTFDYGKRAKAHYQGCRLISDPIRQSKTLLLVVNQLRHTMSQFGPDQDTVGGLAMKYFASLRCHLKRGKRLYNVPGKGVEEKSSAKEISALSKDARFVGIRGRFVVEKTRFTAPFREVRFDLFFRGGLSPFSGWFDALQNHWLDKDGNNIIVGATAKEDPSKIRPGWYSVANEEGAFTKKTFLQWCVEKRPDLLVGYNIEDHTAVPDGDDLEQEEVDEATGNQIGAVQSDIREPEIDDSGNQPTSAADV